MRALSAIQVPANPSGLLDVAPKQYVDAGFVAHYSNSSGDSIANNSEGRVDYTTEDTGNALIVKTTTSGGSVFTIQTGGGGIYLIRAGGRYATTTSTAERNIGVGNNVASGGSAQRWAKNGGGEIASQPKEMDVTAVRRFADGDQFCVWAYQFTGAALVLTPTLDIARIAR